MPLPEAIAAAIITGGLSIIGVLIANGRSAREMDHRLELHQAVTDTKIEELTREVRQHNNFARRMPAVEAEIETLTKSVDKLQGFHME